MLVCFMLLTASPVIAQVDPRVLPFDRQQNDNELDAIKRETEDTQGALLVNPSEIIAKAPYLRALIQMDGALSPYQLDAQVERSINLRQALEIALANNLDIKIAHTDERTSKWGYYGALGAFLPSMSSSFAYRLIDGSYASPFGLLGNSNSANLVMPVNGTLPLFDGGALIFNSLQNRHKYKASQFALKGVTNDIMYQAAQLYYNLLESDILLQVRIKSLQSARAALAKAQERYANGTNTKLDVLQAKTHLSRLRQALIAQQVARRDAAVKLATALNIDPSSDLTPQDRIIARNDLVDEKVAIGDLLQIAVDNRPELKKYEELRLAAKNAFRLAMAKFSPQVVGTIGSYTTGARVASLGSGTEIGGPALEDVGTSIASTSSDDSTGGKKFKLGQLFQVGLSVQWTLGGLGTQQLAEANAAKWQSRKMQLEFNRELSKIWQDVRMAYLDVLNAKNLIAETTDVVVSAEEQVEVANTRLEEGVGTDLEVINAQKDYTSALIDKASAIAKYNVAQAALLRAVGKTSIANMTTKTPLGKAM